MSKISSRKHFREIRDSIVNTSDLSDDIFFRLTDSDLYKSADAVLAYWSVASEVSTQKIIEKALSDSKRVALPKCIDSKGNMEFYYISSASDLSEGMYGIKEPGAEIKADDFSESTVCLVPRLSFDKKGYRLGYGKGYYDRFLSSFEGICLGVCYSEFLLDNIPIELTDRLVDIVITDKEEFFYK